MVRLFNWLTETGNVRNARGTKRSQYYEILRNTLLSPNILLKTRRDARGVFKTEQNRCIIYLPRG